MITLEAIKEAYKQKRMAELTRPRMPYSLASKEDKKLHDEYTLKLHNYAELWENYIERYEVTWQKERIKK